MKSDISTSIHEGHAVAAEKGGAPSATPTGATGLFTDPARVLTAARQLHQAGYRRFDVHTPYPLHGLDEAMGVRPTILPWISLIGGLAGLTFAFAMQWWTGAVDYKLVIGGKPLFAIEPSVPIAFELTVLFSSIATFGGMLALNGLPRWFSRWQNDPLFARMTDDGFVVTIDAEDPLFHHERTPAFLRMLGAEQVRIVEHPST